MKAVVIYCLKCPVTGDVKYIGQTNNLKRRFQRHLTESSKKRNDLGNWLRSLSKPPVLVVLHEVAENESWAEEERHYISCARALGVDLVNATDGGDGTYGYKHTPEHRAKQSATMTGRIRTPEHCAAIRAVKTGVPMHPNTRAAIRAARKGVPWSPAQRAAISARLKGVPKSPEHRAALSASLKGIPQSPERRAAQSARMKGVPQGTRSPEHRAVMSAVRKGVPWSPARRAAYEAGKSAKSSD